ncbi:MAG: TldD/PmbA family protein [Promethearchaeota archaeon]|nr:MAG: TldD/PmbA family protein [Candidatus Lokiarchaeota archaeon]
MDKLELLNQVMARARKIIEAFCTDWAIKGIIRNENQIRFSESKIDINKNWDEIRLNLFLSNKRRTIEMTISDLRPGAIEKTLKDSERLLNVAKVNSKYKKIPEGPFNYDKAIQGKIFDIKVANLEEKAVDIVENATKASLKQGAKRVAGSFFFGDTKFYLTNSKGLEGNFRRTNLNFRIRAFAEDMYATGEAISCSTHLNNKFDPIGAGEEAGEICKKAIGGKKGKPGIYNIIIYPKVSTELQAPTPAIALNAYVKKMGLSWLVGKKEGDKIANDIISTWDDGTMEYGLDSSPFDDELVPTKKTLLIDKGIIKQYFTNTSLARGEEESTGNAGITMPKPSNTVFSTGTHTLEELMEISEKPTLLITSTWYTRYQSYAPPGALSSLPKDGMFLVRNKGKILEPVRELRINSDHFHMLENTLALGKELKQVNTWLSSSGNTLFAPFMLLGNIKMTTGTK